MSEWTGDLIARLQTLWAEGHSTAEIGRRIGMSKCAVVGKAHRLDLPGRKSPIIRSGNPAEPKPRRIKPTATLAPLSSVAAVVVAPPPPKPIARLSKERCQFPLSDGRPWRFCEAIAEADSPYCTKHHHICYVRHPASEAA